MKMNKERTILRRKQKKLKDMEKEKSFDLIMLKREIYQIQKERSIRNIFGEKFSPMQEVSFNGR
jgi:hypothetical protein